MFFRKYTARIFSKCFGVLCWFFQFTDRKTFASFRLFPRTVQHCFGQHVAGNLPVGWVLAWTIYYLKLNLHSAWMESQAPHFGNSEHYQINQDLYRLVWHSLLPTFRMQFSLFSTLANHSECVAFSLGINLKQARQCTHNVLLPCVRLTIVLVEKQ